MKNVTSYAIVALFLFFPIALGLKTLFPEWKASSNLSVPTLAAFQNLEGPKDRTVLLTPSEASWRTYSQGGTSRLAILLTDAQSDWLALAHGLKTIGVPFLITDNYEQALKHRVVFVYPRISGKVLPEKALVALRSYVGRGGTLLGQSVLGGGLNDVFGFSDVQETIKSQTMTLNTDTALTHDFTDSYEKELRIGQKESVTEGAVGYVGVTTKPLATYENGVAALTQNKEGNAFAFGPDVGFLLSRGYNNRQENIGRYYVNHYEPTLDVFLRLIKGLYLAKNDQAVTLSTVPSDKKLSVLITHDVDYTRSVVNAVDYAAFEKSKNIPATYFIQTKYIKDWNDDVFFTQENIPHLMKLQDMGMELASHSVSHSKTYSKFSLGDGRESYPTYTPFVHSRFETKGGSVLGELRVSRYLLETLIPGVKISSFRPGHLSNPYALPQALEATGYRFSSSVTAGDSLTHLPFRLTYGRESGAETKIFEIPVTVEDEERDPMISRLPEAIKLAQTLKRYGGVFVLLIHPDILGQKLAFEKGFVDAMDSSVWFASMEQFGTWWAARDRVEVDVEKKGRSQEVSLTTLEPISGLTFSYPAHWALKKSPADLQITAAKGTAVIKSLAAEKVVLTFQERPQ